MWEIRWIGENFVVLCGIVNLWCGKLHRTTTAMALQKAEQPVPKEPWTCSNLPQSMNEGWMTEWVEVMLLRWPRRKPKAKAAPDSVSSHARLPHYDDWKMDLCCEQLMNPSKQQCYKSKSHRDQHYAFLLPHLGKNVRNYMMLPAFVSELLPCVDAIAMPCSACKIMRLILHY